MNAIVVGERIMQLRKARNMTRKMLAEKANLSNSFIYEIETGRKGFSAETLEHLADALGVELSFIINGNEEKNFELECAATEEMIFNEKIFRIQAQLKKVFQDIQDLVK